MSSPMKRTAVARAALVAALSLLTLATPAATAATPDWTGYLLGPRHSSYNAAATTWTPTTAASFGSDWTFTDPPPTATGQPGRGFNASQIV
jgi:ABC-type sugar transport system substrate-binding protein